MAPRTDLVSRREALKLLGGFAGWGLAQIALAGCDTPSGSPRPEVAGTGEQSVGNWLMTKGYLPDSTIFVPNGTYGTNKETRAFQALRVEAGQNYELVRDFFESVLIEPDMEVIPVSGEDLAQDPEVEAILKGYLGEDGDGVVAVGAILAGTEGLKRLVNNPALISDWLKHMRDRRAQEAAECKAGKEKGVAHRVALMMVIMGAAAAALEAGKPGIMGVTLQAASNVSGPMGESLHALFSVPMDQLDEFLVSVGQSRDTMMLRNLVEWKDAAGISNAVVRLMVQKAGPATAHFLTGGPDRLKQVIDGMTLGKSQFGRLLEPADVSKYLGILAGLKMLYQKGLRHMGNSYQELCNRVGKADVQLTPTPKPITELAVYDQIMGIGVNADGEPVWLNDLNGTPSADNNYFTIVPGLGLPNAILTLP